MKDGGHRHDGKDPMGKHYHKMYELKHGDKSPHKFEVVETVQRVGKKIVIHRKIKATRKRGRSSKR